MERIASIVIMFSSGRPLMSLRSWLRLWLIASALPSERSL